jgi:hypothetical protein
VAEWLRSGLQIHAPQFDSGRGLQTLQYIMFFNALDVMGQVLRCEVGFAARVYSSACARDFQVVRMRLPQAENTALLTQSVWPPSVASSLPLRSHSRAVVSSEAVRMSVSSPENTAL